MSQPAASQSTGGVGLRVLSYNVHGLRDDLAAMTAVVRGLAPDIVIAQEAPRRWRWRTRCADLANRFGLFYAVGGSPSLGNVVLVSSRVRVLATWCVRFPLTPGRHLRGAALARCAVGGSRFVVAGTHLSTDPGERSAQARIVAEVLSAIAEPVVLGVDVNEPDGGVAWKTLAAGRVDAGSAASTPAATFPAASPRIRIDAIFTDLNIKIHDFRAINTAAARRASDHAPIMAYLVLPP